MSPTTSGSGAVGPGPADGLPQSGAQPRDDGLPGADRLSPAGHDVARPVSPTAGGPPQIGRQAGRFFVVGLAAAVVDFGLLTVLMRAGVDYTPAKALSWVAGTLAAYAGNRRWTFEAASSRRRLAAVIVLYASTFVVQVGLFHVLYPVLKARWGATPAVVGAFVIAQGVATVTNFLVQRYVIFSGGGDRLARGSGDPPDQGRRA